jgi:hypothetical protein
MRFCKCLAVVLVGLFGLGYAAVAHAQAGVYVGYQATQLSGITCFDPQDACSSANGKVNPAGVQAGAYYDFRNIGPMRLGVDFRGGTMHSNKSATSSAGGNDTTSMTNALLGVRGSFHTHFSWLNPYLQVSAGYARSNATLPTCETTAGGILLCSGTSSTVTTPIPRAYDNFVQYEGFIGLTVHIFSTIDLRPVELGIGNMNRVGSAGYTTDPSSVGVKSIGASVVFHLPSSQ